MNTILPITTERLIIRPFRADDATAFHGWRNDADVARLTLWDYPYAMDTAEAFCSEMAAMTPFPDGEWYQLMIEERTSGAAIGDIGVGNRVSEGYEVSIGYSLSRGAQGKGYMGEALRALLPALIVPLEVTTFFAEIDVRNEGSGRLLEKLGFHRGRTYERRSFVKGEWCDEADFTLAAEQLTS